MIAFDKYMQTNITPQEALEILKKGNERFVNNVSINRVYLQQMQATADAQHPFGVILSCIDSRASSEIIFDLGLGDVFTIRVAGNIINDDILGSLEFGTEVAGAKLILVLGHTNCGAIKGACDHVELGNLTGLLNKISPQVNEACAHHQVQTSENEQLVFEVTQKNVKASMDEMLNRSDILKGLVSSGKVLLIGGMHDITTGKVTWFE